MIGMLIPIAFAGIFLWAAVIRNGGLLLGCLITLAAGVVLGYDLFHVGSITSDRLLVVVLCATFVFLRTLGQTNTYPVTKTDLCFGGFLAFLFISTFTHEWQWSENYPVARLLFYYALPASLYWISRQAKTKDHVLVLSFAGVAAFGVYLSLTAIAETRGWYGMIFPRYIVTSPTTEFLGRGRGPLLNPIGNGFLICIALVCTTLLWPHVRKMGRTIIVMTCAVLLAGAYCTLTRSVWMSAAGCLVIVGLLSFPVRLRRVCIVAGLLAATALLPVVYQKSKAFKRDKDVSVADMESSASLRPIFARVAWLMFQDRPLGGVGYGQYLKENKNYVHDRETPLRLNLAIEYQQHNLWLSLLVETGLIGVSLFTVTFLLWLRSGWQLWRTKTAPLAARQVGLLFVCITATYFINGMFHELAIIPMLHMAFFCLAGLTVGLWLHYSVPAALPVSVKVLPGFGSPLVPAQPAWTSITHAPLQSAAYANTNA